MLEYNFDPHVGGDTWEGISSITFLTNGFPIDLSNAIVKIDFRRSVDSPAVLSLTNVASAGIVVINALSGIISIPPQIVDIPIGTYQYDLKIKLSSTQVKTYMRGSWDIVTHTTRL